MHTHRFKKAERITSKLLIDRLFGGENKSTVAFPFRVVYIKIPKGDYPAYMFVSVPKKRFHNAVDRNRMKRLTREAYRQQKQVLWDSLEDKDYSLAIAYICLASQLCTYNTVYKSMGKAMNKIIQTL